MATPALVIKGSCDYLSWSSGLAYRQALPGARLVYLRRAGHNTYRDQPAAFLAVVRAFLAGRGVPDDYEDSMATGRPAAVCSRAATAAQPLGGAAAAGE